MWPARCRSTAHRRHPVRFRRRDSGPQSGRMDVSSSAAAPRQASSAPAGCCPLYHEAVELIGRRWTGAILRVLMDGPLRFSEIGHAVPELSDRLVSERMKELE